MENSFYINLSDQQLLSYITKGDEQAFQILHKKYWTPLFRYASRMLKNEQEAEDLLQDVFIKIWKNSASLCNTRNFSAYLYKMCRNRILNSIRNRSARDNFFVELADHANQHTDDILAAIGVKEINNALDREINALPKKMRTVFELSRKKHYSNGEIAEELNLSVKTVKKQINNALKIIRLRINQTSFLLLLFLH